MEEKVDESWRNQTYSFFDSHGRLICEESWFNGQENAIEFYAYDDNGHMTARGYQDWTGQDAARRLDGATFSYTYDARGNQTSGIDDRGDGRASFAVEHAYDEENRRVSTLFAAPPGAPQTRTTYLYDEKGRLNEMRDEPPDEPPWKWIYRYDSRGNVRTIETSRPPDSRQVVRFKYDRNGNEIRIDSDGDILEYMPVDGKVDWRTTIEYDKKQRQVRKDIDGYIKLRFRYVYDKDGRLNHLDEYYPYEKKMKKGRTTSFTHDCWRRPR